MIVRDKPNVFQLFFIMRGSIVPRILPQLVFVTSLGAAVAIAHSFYPELFPEQTLAPFALLGMALSLFLGFRNNAFYDRWWEARKQWGQLIVDSRSLARQATSYIDTKTEGGPQAQRRLVNLTIAFSQALRHRLRGTDPSNDIERYLEPGDTEQLQQTSNVPNALLQMVGKKLGGCRHKMLLSDWLVQSIDERMTSMAKVQAACERIKSTPLPFAYMLLVQRTAYFYCLTLPFGLVASQGFATPLFCAIVAYTFFGLDALSEELEDPFGVATNDLPLSALSRTIEIDLLEILGDGDIPEPIEPDAHCLT